MDDLRRMGIFAKVVELGAFNQAARALDLTTSSISQHIRSLEESLGVALLHRSTRKLSLTEAGQAYYEECATVVHAAERGRQKVATLRDEPAGELRLAVPSQLAHRHVVPALSRFMRMYPQLSLKLEVSDEKIDLISQRIDLAIRIGNLLDSGLVARKIAWFNEVLGATPEYLSRNQMPQTPLDLAALEWVIFTPLGEPSFLDLQHKSGQTARVRIKGRVATNQAQTIRALALTGHGAARLLKIDTSEDFSRGHLLPLLPEWHLSGFGVYAITPRRDAQPLKVTRCIEHLRTYFDELTATSSL